MARGTPPCKSRAAQLDIDQLQLAVGPGVGQEATGEAVLSVQGLHGRPLQLMVAAQVPLVPAHHSLPDAYVP